MTDYKFIADGVERSLPTDVATVESSAFPDTKARGIVVCIGDLHNHVPVQRNIAAAIEILLRKYQFQLVCIEGACGGADTSELWSIPLRRRRRFFDYLFERGYLTGAEFILASRPELGVLLWGVDVAPLYRCQWSAFRKNLAVRQEVVLVLTDFRRTLRRLYTPLISRDLLRLLRLGRSPSKEGAEERRHFKDEDLELLFKRAEAMRLMLPAHLRAVYARWSDGEARRRAAESASSAADAQDPLEAAFAPVVEILKKAPPELRSEFNVAYWLNRHVDEWNKVTRALARQEYSPAKLADRLPERLRAEFRAADTAYWKRLESLDDKLRRAYDGDNLPLGLTLSTEQENQLWEAVAENSCTAEIDGIVFRLERQLNRVLRFLQLRLDPDGSVAFLQGQDETYRELRADLNRLNSILTAAGGERVPFDPVVALLAFWDYSEQYYTVVRQRSIGMAMNTAAEMARRGMDRAVVVSGGFHSGDMSDWLTKSAGFVTSIIHPHVDDSPLVAAEETYNRRGATEE